MMKPSFEDLKQQLTHGISTLLPDNVKNISEDIEENINQLLQRTLSKMNLVTREEFDIQCAVLQRTREKLDLLEAKLDKINIEITDG